MKSSIETSCLYFLRTRSSECAALNVETDGGIETEMESEKSVRNEQKITRAPSARHTRAGDADAGGTSGETPVHPMGFTLRRQPTTSRPGVLGPRPSQKGAGTPQHTCLQSVLGRGAGWVGLPKSRICANGGVVCAQSIMQQHREVPGSIPTDAIHLLKSLCSP